MKPTKYIIIAALMLLFAGGCSVTRNSAFAPDSTRLNLRLSDMEYLGECEISIEYRTYLGFIRAIDTINGVAYDGKSIDVAQLRGRWLDGCGITNPLLSRAAFKATVDFPTATNYLVVRQTTHKERLFLGAEISAKATIRAYRLKE